MTEINDLRERVEAAEQRFGLMDEQQRHYSERVIGLIETIEAQLAAARSEIESQIAENQRLSQENEELRGMLHSVLQSIEQKTFTETLQNLESRVCALVEGAGARTAGAAAPETVQEEEAPDLEAPDLEAPDLEAVVEPEEPAGEEAESPLIIEAAPDEEAEAEAAEMFETTDEASAEDAAAEDMTAEEMADDDVTGDDMAGDDMAGDDVAGDDMAGDDVAGDDVATGETMAEEAVAEAAPGEADMEGAAEAVGEEDEAGDVDMAPMAAVAESDIAEPFETTPEAAMEDVAFEDDPMALAESDDEAEGGGTVASEMAVPEPEMAEPEVMDAGTAEIEAPEIEAAEIEAAEIEAPEAEMAELTESEAQDETQDEGAPTVKEIIRRVGDLARELEKAEAQRKASLSGAAAADAGEAPAASGDPDEMSDAPPLDHAANG
ncbi:hypothetical protein AAFN88_04310 [Pelagibius sp. CAU 1746]|uniref:hypothetical protein n=1 Tax=Pelagibius sp. CAU 1746 TaxID=3140370 RepID=UPI00325AC89B